MKNVGHGGQAGWGERYYVRRVSAVDPSRTGVPGPPDIGAEMQLERGG